MLWVAGALSLLSCSSAPHQPDRSWEVELQQISGTASSRGTAYLDSNKIVETREGIYVTYLDNSLDGSTFDVMVRRLDLATSSWSLPLKLGNTPDNHGDPTLVVDHRGYFHLMYGGHGVLKYRKSLSAFDASGWTAEEELPETGELTYPSLVVDRDNTLFLVARHYYNRVSLLKLYTRKVGDAAFSAGVAILKPNHDYWLDRGEVLYKSSGYVRWYTSLCADASGRLHLAFQNYEYLPVTFKTVDAGGARSYLIGYMYSDDLGLTWKADGQTLALPATPRSIEIVAGQPFPDDASPYYGMGRLALDRAGVPHIMYLQLYESQSKVIVASKTGDAWTKREILADPTFERFACQESSFTIDLNGNYYFLLTMVRQETFLNPNWGNDSSEIRLLISEDGGESLHPLTPLHNEDNTALWLPALPYAFSENEPPAFLFLRGGKGKSNTDIVKNQIYFGRIRHR